MKRKLEEVVTDAAKTGSLFQEYEEMLEQGIIELVSRREKSCWPSEVPRVHLKLVNWKELCPVVRKIAFELARNSTIKVLQKGKMIEINDIDTVKGPIRLSRI